jgi:hypothetical protein
MHLSPIETALNMQLTPSTMDYDLSTHGFPSGYFVIRNVATGRLVDVQSDKVDDSTSLILYPETESSLVEGMCLSYGRSFGGLPRLYRHAKTRGRQPGK